MGNMNPTEEELGRRRALRDKRIAEAERLQTSIGWIGPDGKCTVDNPPKLEPLEDNRPKRPKRGIK